MNPRKLVTGLLVAVVIVAAYLLISGGDDGYTLKAELPDAGGVKQYSSVKIAGVPGGTVKKITITPRDTALVTMKIDKDSLPIGKNASIEVRPTDLLGERYIALNAGNVKDPAPSGFEIPKSRTHLPVELDDVLNTFDADTRTRIKILVNEFGVALGDQGKDLASLLDAMPASLSDARQLVTEITNEDGSLKQLLQRGDQLTASVDPKKDQLASLIVQADTTLQALSDRRDKLGRTLDAAPGGLAALNTTLHQLNQASTDLRPASVDIKNAAQPLLGTLNAVPGFEQAARGTLKSAKQTAPALTKLGKKATGPLKALTPTLANVKQFTSDVKPTLDQFDNRAFEDALWMVQSLALSTKFRDGIGRTLKVAASVNPETFKAVFQSLFNETNQSGDPLGAKSKSKVQTKSNPTTKAPTTKAPTTSAPTTSSPPTTTGSSPAPQTQDKGLLGGLVDGVSGLLGGNAGTNAKPGASNGGVTGLLNNLLHP